MTQDNESVQRPDINPYDLSQVWKYIERDEEHEMQSIAMGISCNCGNGYCHVHGTFHYQEQFEMAQLINKRHQSPMGRRSIRKPRFYE